MVVTNIQFANQRSNQRNRLDVRASANLKTNNSIPSFGALVEPLDKFYKVALQKGLKEKFGLKCKLDDLNSIAGPFELKKLISKFTPRDFELGPKTNGIFIGDKAHEYALDGTFRVNLHLHSRVSDGSLTPVEMLDMCVAYANKVAKKLGDKLNKKDGIPPFTASLTDHDKFAGSVDIIKEIAQNPKKYENFKFVVGSEFFIDGYKKPYTAFEAIGLGFNPFDKVLNDKVTKVQAQPNSLDFIRNVKNAGGTLSLAHPIFYRDRLNDDFFGFIKKNGIDGVEGNYQYCGFKYDKEFLETIEKVKKLATTHDMFLTGGTDSHSKQIFGRCVSGELLSSILND